MNTSIRWTSMDITSNCWLGILDTSNCWSGMLPVLLVPVRGASEGQFSPVNTSIRWTSMDITSNCWSGMEDTSNCWSGMLVTGNCRLVLRSPATAGWAIDSATAGRGPLEVLVKKLRLLVLSGCPQNRSGCPGGILCIKWPMVRKSWVKTGSS